MKRQNLSFVILLLSVVVFSTSFSSVYAQESNVILLPTDDTVILSDINDPDDVQGLEKIVAGNLDSLPVSYSWNFNNSTQQLITSAYLKFDLSDINPEEINSAVLQMYGKETKINSNSTTMSVFSIDDVTWTESDLSFETMTKFNQTLNTINVLAPGWYEWDITQHIKDNANSEISLAIMFDIFNHNREELVIFASKEFPDPNLQPVLLIEKTIPESLNIQNLTPTDDSFFGLDITKINDMFGLRTLNAGDSDFIKVWYAYNVTSSQEFFNTFGILKFDLSELNTNDVTDANLKMKTIRIDSSGADRIISLHHLNSTDWDESTITYENSPGLDSEIIDTIEMSRPNVWHSWNVTKIIKNNTNTEISLGLNYERVYPVHEEQTVFYSKESEFSPYLEITLKEQSGGCLIATATYGSELAPQVQQLRELRDNHLLQTSYGSAFMTGFNQFYYSFSPTIADLERENPIFKELVKLSITPLISSLSLLNHVDLDSESSVLGYGLSIIALNVGIYLISPVVGLKIAKKLLSKKEKDP